MQKITPFLWFDTEAEEAIQLYSKLFNDVQVLHSQRYPESGLEGPMQGLEGKIQTAVFQIGGYSLIAMNGGPHHSFSPAISLFVNCQTEAELDKIWAGLAETGSVLMPLQAYPFSPKFGWLEDKFGVSWQLNLSDKPQIAPFLLFSGSQYGKAKEAINLYTALFEQASIEQVQIDPTNNQTITQALFTLEGQPFMAMDSAVAHEFTFTDAFSLQVICQTQAEVDLLWQGLAQGGQEKPCGWLTDRFGVAWQIVPALLPKLLSDPNPQKVQQVVAAMLQMTKIDTAVLQSAYDNELA